MRKFILCIALTAALIAGCSPVKEKADESYVVKINNTAVSREEFNIYLYETQKSFEALGGEDIWETDFDGRSAESVAKDNTLSTVTLVKLAEERAVKNGITLDDTEKEDAQTEAEAMYDELTDSQREAIGADKELYYEVMLENFLYNKVYADTVKDYTVSDEDFEGYYSTNLEELKNQYRENVSSDEPINEAAVKDYSRSNFEKYMKQMYFTKEYEKWESSAIIEKNSEVWNTITLIR